MLTIESKCNSQKISSQIPSKFIQIDIPEQKKRSNYQQDFELQIEFLISPLDTPAGTMTFPQLCGIFWNLECVLVDFAILKNQYFKQY